nr:MAG TPA: hypothetical protein [Caudoviricetes sp.]DAJ89450.1 MAG TPA: hypothetical protein [Bacteriophage sp.]DAO26247.1 MAG TPA: hypothetical protein [Caudoviricetes sp.]
MILRDIEQSCGRSWRLADGSIWIPVPSSLAKNTIKSPRRRSVTVLRQSRLASATAMQPL